MPKLKAIVYRVLSSSKTPLAVHEMGIIGYSENNIATRMSDYAREGWVEGTYRKGQSYKEWYLKKGQIDLLRISGL